MAPRIGLVMNYHLSPDGVERAYIDTPYIDYILAHGGVPVPILPLELKGDTHCSITQAETGTIHSFLDPIDAIIFTGGLDLDPALWNEPRHPQSTLLHPRRQKFDLALYRLAAERQLPILMICLGIQVLNVAHGGILCQHLPDRRSTVDHGGQGRLTRHTVQLHPDSQLAEILNTAEIDVNSTHHQGILEPASSLTVTAAAPDGVIEALERPEYPSFLLGVQWHPEKEPLFPASAAIMKSFLASIRD
jgi:putative glutamine amidotransferase